MKKINLIALISLIIGISFGAQADPLDTGKAVVRMNVAEYAKITNLNDFILRTVDDDGSAGAVYSGFDNFNLESNTAVQVTLEGEQLTNGARKLSTKYSLNEKEMNFSTAKGVHKGEHKVSASATLGNISDQEAGGYSANILITVSALVD